MSVLLPTPSHTSTVTVGLPSTVVYDLLGAMKLLCSSCHEITTACQYRLHKGSDCQGHCKVSSPSHVSARDILQRLTTAPTLPVEKKLA